MEQKRNFEDKLMKNEKVTANPIGEQNKQQADQNKLVVDFKPVNKQGPDDWKKMQECSSLIKKLN